MEIFPGAVRKTAKLPAYHCLCGEKVLFAGKAFVQRQTFQYGKYTALYDRVLQQEVLSVNVWMYTKYFVYSFFLFVLVNLKIKLYRSKKLISII